MEGVYCLRVRDGIATCHDPKLPASVQDFDVDLTSEYARYKPSKPIGKRHGDYCKTAAVQSAIAARDAAAGQAASHKWAIDEILKASPVAQQIEGEALQARSDASTVNKLMHKPSSLSTEQDFYDFQLALQELGLGDGDDSDESVDGLSSPQPQALPPQALPPQPQPLLPVQPPPPAVPPSQPSPKCARLFDATPQDEQRVADAAHQSMPNVVIEKVYKIEHPTARQRFDTEAARIGGKKFVWHSSTATDPLVLVESEQPFDPQRSGQGSYGEGSYFAEHLCYSDLVVPCRKSKLFRPVLRSLPNVGDDICLVGSDEVFEVMQVGTGVDESECVLRRLRWHTPDGDLAKTVRLGRGNGKTSWASADLRFVFYAEIAITPATHKDYGSKCVSNHGNVEPDGFETWGGTESDFYLRQFGNRPDYKPDLDAARALYGGECGRQYVIARDYKAFPTFLVMYRSPRTKPSLRP